MADLRVLSTGREFRRIDEGTAKLLEELFPENLERINPLPQRPATANAASAAISNPQKPIWGIFTAPLSGNVSIKCSFLRGEHFYDGPPERAAAFSVGGHVCPLEVVDAYARVKAQPPALSEYTQLRDENAREAIYFKGGGVRPKAE